jgi:hypothetical protein
VIEGETLITVFSLSFNAMDTGANDIAFTFFNLSMESLLRIFTTKTTVTAMARNNNMLRTLNTKPSPSYATKLKLKNTLQL